jgi:hypothetical protein
MRVAVYTNSRTTIQCCRGELIKVVENGEEKYMKNLKDGFFTAVLGFCLVGLALLVLDLIIVGFKVSWFDDALM